MAVVLLDPPHPWLLPLLVLLVLLEVGAALGKRQWCQALAKEVKGLTIRKVDVMLQMNKVRGRVGGLVCMGGRVHTPNDGDDRSCSCQPMLCAGTRLTNDQTSIYPHTYMYMYTYKNHSWASRRTSSRSPSWSGS